MDAEAHNLKLPAASGSRKKFGGLLGRGGKQASQKLEEAAQQQLQPAGTSPVQKARAKVQFLS